MSGDQQKRFCGECNKYVHDLSEYSRAEAEKLMSGEGSVCVRMRRDARGRVVTADDLPLGRMRAMLRRPGLKWVSGVLIFAVTFLTACERAVTGMIAKPTTRPIETRTKMGEAEPVMMGAVPPLPQPKPRCEEAEMGMVPTTQKAATQPGDAGKK